MSMGYHLGYPILVIQQHLIYQTVVY